jgi:hypothetical protein
VPLTAPPPRSRCFYHANADLQAAAALPLVRDFIHEALYDPQRGYFARAAPVVGHLGVGDASAAAPPIDFQALRSRDAYYEEVQRRYAALQSAWLTPAEILSPHYGAAVAAFAAARHDARFGAARAAAPPLRLYELGAGTGTLARDALGWLRATRPDLYARTRYTAVEISAPLAALQAARVGAAGHGAAFAVARGDAAAAATWAAIAGGEDEECLIVATEVLDNLPHDRVWRPDPGAPWRQTHVRPVGARGALAAGAAAFEEVLAPAADPLVLRCLAAAARVPGAGGLPFGGLELAEGGGWAARAARALARAAAGPAAGAWLPTGAAALLAVLHAARPRAGLLALDFDALPEVAAPGAGAPLVSATRGGAARDRASYLLDPGSADIFFPTDFRLLRELYLDAGAAAGGGGGGGGDSGAGSVTRNGRNCLPPPRVEAVKAAAFFARWAPGGGPAAADGFRPLLEDYSNTSALVAEPAPAGGALAWV